jgi:hypothetical protein
MAEQTAQPKKRGRKKLGEGSPATKAKRGPKNIENMSFEQLMELSNRITEVMKTKKDEQIKALKDKLARLESM